MQLTHLKAEVYGGFPRLVFDLTSYDTGRKRYHMLLRQLIRAQYLALFPLETGRPYSNNDRAFRDFGHYRTFKETPYDACT
jgi:hypothetical protein